MCDAFLAAGDGEAALGGDLLAFFRDEAGTVRANVAGDTDDFFGEGHLEIHACSDGLSEHADVVVLHVATVLSEMEGDLVGAGELSKGGGGDRGGLVGTTGLAHGGDVIYVHAKGDPG